MSRIKVNRNCRYCGSPLKNEQENYCSQKCDEKDSIWNRDYH